ncbi:MAG: transcriptional regulator [Candidatus Freyarchaeota archaeon]|nr:transcriptional regulator [Candidatus Jordarchaeia archaeon]
MRKYWWVVMSSTLSVEKVGKLLQRAGFQVANNLPSKSCFDLVARRDNLLMLLKVLANVDALKDEQGRELRTLARLLSATPLVVGEKTRKSEMLDGVVYGRCGIPTINFSTFRRFILEDVWPVALARRGGLYIRVDGEALRRAREGKGLSLGNLAERIGVSRKAIYEYERNEMDATLETALKIEDELDADIIIPVDLSEWRSIYDYEEREEEGEEQEWEDELEKEVFEALSDLGFKVILARRAPFDALTADQKEECLVVTGVGRASERTIEKRIIVLEKLSWVAQKLAMFVMDKNKKITGTRVPIFSKEEIESMKEPEELLRRVQRSN